MLNLFLVVVLAVYAGAVHWIIKKKLIGRIKTLEQELHTFSDVVIEMVEIQTKSHEKVTTGLEDLEERILDLSVPSHDANLPLERRHKVLTLARQGVAVEDISKRLGTPVGEAELILNLRKYRGGKILQSTQINEQVRPYAQI
jgi:hypothetical protein